MGIEIILPQLELLHKLIPHTSKDATVIVFAGGGVNKANQMFSSYTISKLALTKAVEVLASEDPCRKYCCIGPGWVDTKIHNEVLDSVRTDHPIYQETKLRKRNNRFVPMSNVVEMIEWIIGCPIEAVSGRNFSVAYDRFRDLKLVAQLIEEPELGKLRRFGNAFLNGLD